MSKIVLNGVRDVPLNKLHLSQANVRRIKAGVSIEELAEDIARRGLLQSLSVRPVLDADGDETGAFEVPAGGRRFEALKLLVKKKRMSATVKVPCIVRTDGVAEEDSLAENTMREALHPLDQFRAFQALRNEHGIGDEEIAARFFVTPAVVRQRLKLAAASAKLLDLYAGGELTLEQLMAFCVTSDHARQEQVWDALARSHSREPYAIRRLLTEHAVKASDKRAVFVGAETYEAAGGSVVRDLFQQDGGGWFDDPALLERLVREKLETAAEAIRSEGWRWVEVAPDFSYGHTFGLRRLASTEAAPSAAEQTEHDRLRAEYDSLEAEHAGSNDYLPEEVDARLAELETALARIEDRPRISDPDEVARAGVFVSLDYGGAVAIDRGWIRSEDELPVEPAVDCSDDGEGARPEVERPSTAGVGGPAPAPDTPDEEDGIRPLPERLLTELTAHRTVALRDALAGDFEVAFLAALHALALRTLYRFGYSSCLEIEAKSAGFSVQAPGLADTAPARAIEARQGDWRHRLPDSADALWDALVALDGESRRALFAHCVGVTVNAVHEPWNRGIGRIAHADVLAGALGLDVAASWSPTADGYLGRVTKARILQAVREAKGNSAAQLIDHLKKPEMAKEAERLIAGTGWLPEPLRTPGLDAPVLPLSGSAEPAEPAAPDDTDADLDAELPAYLTDVGEARDARHFIAAE
ncbi:ParB/RepB/Spo0J family partition protein [uncultured Enterovirga sp.]|uniref:ParB/RepB/Spo0J family partition protein n=1 Tax=uncultured Enterovirga sp. TaxID=2026352 RepID=UPI0035CA2687